MTSVGIIASSVVTGAVLLEPFNNFTFAPWANTGATIVTGRNGTAAQTVGGSGVHADFTIPAASESDIVTVGAAWRYTDANTLTRDIFRFNSDAGVTQHNRVSQVGAGVNVTRGATGLTATGNVLAVNTWAYIEAQICLHDTAGYVIVHVNGVEVTNTTALDTKNAGTKTVYDRIIIGGFATGATCQWDDLYITVGAGAPFKGDIVVP